MKYHYLLKCLPLLYFLASVSSFQAQVSSSLLEDHFKANYKSLSIDSDVEFLINSEGSLSNKAYRVVYLQQAVNGIKVANANATILVKDNSILNVEHNFIKNIKQKLTQKSTTTALSPNAAAQKALSQLGLSKTENVSLLDFQTKEDLKFSSLKNNSFSAPKYYQKTDENSYVLTYEIIIKTPDTHWWVCKVNANTGEIESKFDMNISCNFDLPRETDANPSSHATHKHSYNGELKAPLNLRKKNTSIKSETVLYADGAVYNAYPLRVETPIHGEREILVNPAVISTQPSGRPTPSPNGWHDLNGTIQTNTNGNNVMAYEDSDNTDAPTFISSLVEGGPNLIFDFPIDLSQEPEAYQKATIVNLFVWNNYIHDIFYAYGFDEDNGNFQEEDYDRFTGTDIPLVTAHNGDGVSAEAQDGSGLNNANFATPADGGNPTMQMFLWGASPFGEFLTVNSPTEIARKYNSTRFPFVPIPRPEEPEISASLVLIEDDGTAYGGANGGTAGPSPDTDDGCTSIVNAAALDGNIAVIKRGVCTFTTKIYNAQDAGAIAVIIVNNVEGEGPANGGGEPTDPITIPTISISLEDGNTIIDAINAGNNVSARVVDDGPLADLVMKDGDLDQGIIAHEYGHGISTRLVGGRNNSNCLLSLAFEEQMGEGWSDFFALVTTQQLNDTAEQPRGIGTYVLGQDRLGSGIRPARYSTDFSVNDYTYEDLGNDEITVPHGVGFIWSTILWDMYWAFIDEYGFDADMYYGSGGNNMALQLVVDGLKLQTCGNVGFVDGRDAILRADDMINDGANECLIRRVFARRGVGAMASQGTAASRMDQTADFTVSNPLGTDCDQVLGNLEFDKTFFTVYPNPARQQVFINSNRNGGSGSLSIFDINGRQVVKQSIEFSSTISVDTSELSTGIYVLKIQGDSASHTQKLIIK